MSCSLAPSPRVPACRCRLVLLLSTLLLASAWSTETAAQESLLPPSELDVGDDVDLGGLLEMIDVVVTPAKKEQTVEQAPSIVSVIKASDFVENGYRSVADALRQIPGIYVRDDLIHPNVSMRGVDPGLRAWSRNIKVMINGQPISYRSDTSNWLGPELIPVDVISRIEVVRGPGSTLYGANAFLGVVNIITVDGFEKDWGQATAESGFMINSCYKGNKRVQYEGESFNLCELAPSQLDPVTRASASVGHTIQLGTGRQLSFLFGGSAGYSDRSGLLLPSTSPHFGKSGPRYFAGEVDDVTSDGDHDLWVGAFGQVALVDDRLGKIRLEGHYTEFARHGEFTDWGVLTRENRVALRNWYVLAGLEKRLQVVPLSYQLRVALAGGEHTGANHLQVARDNSYWVKKVGGYLGYDINAELSYELTPKVMLIGGAWITEDFHDLPSIYSVEDQADAPGGRVQVPSYLLGDVNFLNVQGFAQLLYSPIEALSLIGGVSYEQHNVYGRCTWSSCPGLNGRLGASYSILRTSELSLYSKLLYGSSFKAPPAELLYGTPYVISGISGNLDLAPEVAHTFEAALGSGALLLERRIRLDVLVNGFLNLVDGKAEYIQAGNFIQATNSSNLETLGVESSVKLSYKKEASAYFNISWQETRLADCLLDNGPVCRTLGELNALYPDLLISFGAAYRLLPWHLRLSLYGTYVGSRWSSQSNRAENLPALGGGGSDAKAYKLPGYTLLNAVASTTDLRLFGAKETVFSVGVYNLLNSGIVEPGFNGIDTPWLGLTALGTVRQRF